ncbi:helix-turn-helix domain-containing protein [Enterococcus rivorum]|nr:helix-turn-helix transcriptional regulator [Enterococcus rivorum]MBP2098047.1 transcriptional regulator with XRE-family HTH domain [Enterococcus rivorum]
MNIIQAIRYLRKQKNIKQKEMLQSKRDYQTYNRIETEQRKLNLTELIEISNKLDMPIEELLSYCDYSKLKLIDKNFVLCTKLNIATDNDFKQLIDNYQYLKSINFKSTGELALYYDIKAVFTSKFPEIEEISKLDLHIIYRTVFNTNYFTYYDYRLVANTIILMDTKKGTKLINKLFPLEDRDMGNDKTLLVASRLIINFISGLINNRKFAEAKQYIQFAKNLAIDPTNYFFHFTIYYYENLILHFQTQKLKYLNKVYEYILLLEKTGHKEFAQSLELEIQKLIYSDDIVEVETTIVLREN